MEKIVGLYMGKTTKWTKELVLAEARKYKTRGKFQKGNNGARKAADRLGILEEACSHMPDRVDISGKNNVRFKWSDEALRNEALKYRTKQDFQDSNRSAYGIALKRKSFFESICSHMPEYTKIGHTNPNFMWTDEMLYLEAKKYTKKQDFKKGSRGAFEACNRRGILALVCSHMFPSYKKWTDESLALEALKYDSRSEFELKDIAAYSAALARKIMDEICKHM